MAKSRLVLMDGDLRFHLRVGPSSACVGGMVEFGFLAFLVAYPFLAAVIVSRATRSTPVARRKLAARRAPAHAEISGFASGRFRHLRSAPIQLEPPEYLEVSLN